MALDPNRSKAKLEIQKPVLGLSEETRSTLPHQISDSLEGVANKETTQTLDLENQPENSQSAGETLTPDEINDERNVAAVTPEFEVDEDNASDPYQACLKELKKEGYDFAEQDIDTFLKIGFKVKFPKTYILISILNFLSSIVLSLTGMLMFLIGAGSSALGIVSGFFTFGIGTLVGGAVGTGTQVIGLGVLVMSIATNITLAIASMVSQIYYLKSASTVVKKTGILKKYIGRLMLFRVLMVLFSWVPLLNGAIFLLGGRSFWRMVKHETEKVEKIVRKYFPK